MGFRINLALPLAGIIVLSACQQQDQREPIKTAQKGAKVQAANSACNFNSVQRRYVKFTGPVKPEDQLKDKTGKLVPPKQSAKPQETKEEIREVTSGGCLNLQMLIGCLDGAKNEMARLTTTDVQILKPVMDPKALAQILNQPGELSLKNHHGRMSEVRPTIDELNTVVQTGCDSVTIKDAKGAMVQYALKDPRPGHLVMENAAKGGDQIVIRAASPGKVLIQRTRELEAVVCGKPQKFLVREKSELTYGSLALRGNYISKDLAQLLIDHTDTNENLKLTLKGSERKDSGKAKIEGREEMIAVDEIVIDDAFSRVGPEKLNNLECTQSYKPLKPAN